MKGRISSFCQPQHLCKVEISRGLGAGSCSGAPFLEAALLEPASSWPFWIQVEICKVPCTLACLGPVANFAVRRFLAVKSAFDRCIHSPTNDNTPLRMKKKYQKFYTNSRRICTARPFLLLTQDDDGDNNVTIQ